MQTDRYYNTTPPNRGEGEPELGALGMPSTPRARESKTGVGSVHHGYALPAGYMGTGKGGYGYGSG